MARSSSGTVSVHVEVDSRAVLAAFRGCSREVNDELRDESVSIARSLAGHLVRAAHDPTAPPQAALLAPTVKPARDRIVKVNIGGTKRVGRAYRSRRTGRRTQAPAWAVMWGSEYGGHRSGRDSAGRTYGNRFVRGRNLAGYWILPTIKAHGDDARRAWVDAVDRVARRHGLRLGG